MIVIVTRFIIEDNHTRSYSTTSSNSNAHFNRKLRENHPMKKMDVSSYDDPLVPDQPQGSGHPQHAQIIIFLHVHKCAGTFFLNLVRKSANHMIPPDNGLLRCPPMRIRTALTKSICGDEGRPLLPFWTWPADIQTKFLMELDLSLIHI